MNYKDLVKNNYQKFKGNDKVMWESVESVSMLLDSMKEAHPDIYWKFMREQHELMFGKHFDHDYAKWQVEQMYHTGDDGKQYKGEHWTMEDTNGVLAKYRSKINSNYNEYDFYVALNAHYHDYCGWAKKQFPDAYEQAIIDMAVQFWFMDQDWPDTSKVWEYFTLINNHKK